MAKEIEKKYLINKVGIEKLLEKAIEKHEIEQSYIMNEENSETRVRSSLVKTYKNKSLKHINLGVYEKEENTKMIVKTIFTYTRKEGTGVSRDEFEKEIPEYKYDELKEEKIGKTVTKTRYKFPNEDKVKFHELIVDYYPELNLYVAEIEFNSIEYIEVKLPEIFSSYIIKDISAEPKYANKYMAFNEVKWRPTYYIVEDFLVMEQNYHIIKNLKFNNIFLPSYFLDKYHILDNTHYFPLYHKECKEKQKFSPTIFPTLYAGATVIYTMIQIAIYMGFKEIYLIGIDFHFDIPKNTPDPEIIIDEGKQNHFHNNYRNKNEKWFIPNLERQKEAFKLAKEYAIANNIRIYNASRESKLDIFQRIKFDELFHP